MCQNDPTLEKPVCVDWCLRDVLTYEEREIEVDEDEEAKLDEMKVGLQALAYRFGLDEIKDAVNRMAKKG
jgi:benzoyl-CoA reductase subunit BamC